MLNSKSIGRKIAEARKKINFSQAELAKQVSISAQAVGKWERGESMPDISTLNRLAEILEVDLNYFSERFHDKDSDSAAIEKLDNNFKEPPQAHKKQSNWDMSKLNLTDSDFSGLKNLHEKLNSSNIQKCLFIGSDMSGLFLNNNNINNCDFSNSELSKSNFQNSMLNKNNFNSCKLNSTKFSKSFAEGCDFTNADFTETTFIGGGFAKNIIENTKLIRTKFIDMAIQDIVFEGSLEDCHFENCTFYGVKFQNAKIINTFFKNNKKFKRVKLINCTVDKLTYAFLKNNLANLSEITII